MNKETLEVPKSFNYKGVSWTTAKTSTNIFYRALAFPIGGGNPRWFSSEEMESVGRD